MFVHAQVVYALKYAKVFVAADGLLIQFYIIYS